MEGRIENHGNKKGCKEEGRKEEETLVLLRPNRGGRASVPFFFALCCRSVTPVVFTSRLSLGQCLRKSFGRVSSSEPYDAALKRRTTRASVLLRVGIAAEAKLPHSRSEEHTSELQS